MNPDTMNQPAQSPTTSGGQMPMPIVEEKKGMGGVVTLVIIILALLAGGYFLMQKMNGGDMVAPEVIAPVVENTGTPNNAQESSQAMIDTNTVQGTSIDLSDIEKDIEMTDLDSLTADLSAI